MMYPVSRECLWSLLVDLDSYPLWIPSIISLSEVGPLREGLAYEAKSRLYGRITGQSRISVTRLLVNDEIELVNESGVIAYRAMYKFIEVSPKDTELVFTLRFEFNYRLMGLGHIKVERSARARIEGDLKRLLHLIEKGVLPR
jgi:ribosome-associated toxin RatA of RatAB toxin-antitoxin module